MVNNQKIYIKKEGSLVRRKNTFKKKTNLYRVLSSRPGHGSTRQVDRILPSFCLVQYFILSRLVQPSSQSTGWFRFNKYIGRDAWLTRQRKRIETRVQVDQEKGVSLVPWGGVVDLADRWGWFQVSWIHQKRRCEVCPPKKGMGSRSIKEEGHLVVYQNKGYQTI
jgi:hypothetical protein